MGDMSVDFVLSLSAEMIWTAVLLCGPLISATLLVGLLVSILQAVTQIQESSLSFVPKLATAAVVLLILGGWMLNTLGHFATHVISQIPTYL